MAPAASLQVRISAQISELQKSFSDATSTVNDFKGSFEKHAQALQSTVDSLGKTFSSLGPNVATIGVAFVGVQVAFSALRGAFELGEKAIASIGTTLRDAVLKTADLGDNFYALSQKTSLSVESLSALKFVAGQTNTSLETITGAVFKMEANLGKGGKATADALNGIGLSLKNLKSEDPSQAFASIVARIGELPNATERAAAGVAIFGKSFKDIAQLSQEDLPALTKQAKDLGLVMSTETAVASDRLKDAFGVLHGAGQGLQQQLGAKLLPGVIALSEVFGGIYLDALKSATGSTAGLGLSFDKFVVQIGQGAGRAIEVLAKLADATAQWAIEGIARVVDQANAFLDLAPSIIVVGRALDLALSGGGHASAFDALTKKLEEARQPLAKIGELAVSSGAKIREFAQGIATAAAAAGENFGATYKRIQKEIGDAAEAMRKKLGAGAGGVGGSFDESNEAVKSFSKSLGTLTAQIDLAERHGTPLADLVELFGREASKSAQKAHAWGITVASSVDNVARAFDRAELETAFSKIKLPAPESFTSLFGNGSNDPWIVALKARVAAAKKAQDELAALNTPLLGGGFGAGVGLGFTSGQLASMGLFGQQAAEASEKPFRDVFHKLGQDLPGIVFDTLKNGGSIVGAVASSVGVTLSQAFAKALSDASGDMDKVSKSSKALGIAGASITAGITGFQLGQQLGKGKGALAGAAAGAAAGSVVPGIGTAIGAGVGALAGYFGGRSAEKKAKQQMEEQKAALAQQYGGMAKLKDLATKLGVNIQAAFDAKKPEQFKQAVDSLNTAIDAQNTRVAGLGKALEGVNARATTLATQFQPLVDQKNTALQNGDTDGAASAAAKLMAAAATAQPEFERLGLLISGTFGGMVKESGNAFEALQKLSPAFTVLKSGVSEFGFTSTGVIDELLKNFALVNDTAFAPLLQNVQNTGQVLQGLFDAKALSPDVFQAAATDIGQSLQEVANRGGDISAALALSQPVLQSLYEAQKRYGGITDQTTLSILDQAQKQGLVGEAMKGVNDKILDVLLAIGKVLKADLPSYFAGLEKPAKDAASGIESAFRNVKIDIPYSFNQVGDGPQIPDVQALGRGGIVQRPTLALVGESGPEAVVPLNRAGLGLSGQAIVVETYLDGDLVARNTARRLPGILDEVGA